MKPPSIPRIPARECYPLSFAQERLWFLDQFEPASSLYNVIWAVEIRGNLHVGALERALNGVVARHATLRTTFQSVDGTPVQVIAEYRPARLPVEELSGPEATVRSRMQREGLRPFDLAHDAMLRPKLFRLEPRRHILLLTLHHIASDGWSTAVLFRELSELYAAELAGRPAMLPELPIQYTDFAVWQRDYLQGDVLDNHLAYWKRQLAGTEILAMPTDHPRPASQNYWGVILDDVIDERLSAALAELSRRERVTLFMTLLGAFAALLHRYTGQNDLAIGMPIANRTRVESEGLIGLFVNTLVLRVDLAGQMRFRDLLRRVRDLALEAYEHQDLPFEKLVEALQPERSLSYTPLFQVYFGMHNTPRQELAFPGLELRRYEVETETSKFDFGMQVEEVDGTLNVRLHYATHLFERETMERFLGHYRRLLEGVVADSGERLSRLPVLSLAGRREILSDWNVTRRDYPQLCAHQLFEEQAGRCPEAEAVVFAGRSLTYQELNIRANRLAHHLRALGVGPDVLVGLAVERSLEFAIGMLGILKAGGGWLSLDPSLPPERLAVLLDDARPPVVLTSSRSLAALPDYRGHMLVLDAGADQFPGESQANPPNLAGPENLAYAMYTSGSTGKPKGVLNVHRGLANWVLWLRETIPLSGGDRVLHKSPLSFDAAVLESFHAFVTGACLVIARPEGHRDPEYLAGLIASERVTTAQFVPSMLEMFLETGGAARCGCLQRILLGGEIMPRRLQDRFHNLLPAELHNLYGPTEVAVAVTHWKCVKDDPHPVVPLGRPVANTAIYILDANMQPVPPLVRGEIFIGGASLARGYLNLPGLTAEKFIPDPFSDEPGARLYRTGDMARFLAGGIVEFLGRTDDQVKLRGIRIELGEIEAVLSEFPAVGRAVAMVREDQPGDKRLVAYLQPVKGADLREPELRGFLAKRLPEYMVPSALVVVPALPLTSSGKVDRLELPAPRYARPELDGAFAEARTPLERTLAGLWREVLKTERAGVNDNFFQLGGHSLLAMQLVSRIRRALHVDVPVRLLFESPTIAELAAAIERLQDAGMG